VDDKEGTVADPGPYKPYQKYRITRCRPTAKLSPDHLSRANIQAAGENGDPWEAVGKAEDSDKNGSEKACRPLFQHGGTGSNPVGSARCLSGTSQCW
jgi:hypothetical protein